MKKLLPIFISLMMTLALSAQVIHIPTDYTTIQEGIDAANHGDTVLVDDGTYYENIRFMGKAITVASQFIMDGDTNHINNTIINGSMASNSDSASCVMFVHGEDTTSVINGFTLTGGGGTLNMTWQVKAGGGIFARNSGAKILNNKIIYNLVEGNTAGGGGVQCLKDPVNAWVIIKNNTISHNTTIAHGFSAFGGGISVTVNARIKNNVIEYNSCTNDDKGADGGGIEVERMPGSPQLDIVISNNTIRHNTLNGVNSAIGAGIMSIKAEAKVLNNTITNNEANASEFSYGAGIYIWNSATGALIRNNIINNNNCNADYSYGGGISVRNSGYTTISDNEINNNMATGSGAACGGGIWLDKPQDSSAILRNNMRDNELVGNGFGGGCAVYESFNLPVSVSRNLIKGNISSTTGGGIFSFNSFNLSICNNIIQENDADYQGGGIFMRYYPGDNSPFKHLPIHDITNNNESANMKTIDHPLIINNTLLNNTAKHGGAAYTDLVDEFPIFINNIFWGNTATNSYNEIYNPVNTVITIAYCNIDTNEVDGPWEGKNNFHANPVFLDPECHLAWQSTCIGAGIEMLDVGDTSYCCPSEDFEGDPRPMCGVPDIGADETDLWQSISEVSEINNISLSPNPSSGAIHLRYSILETRDSRLEMFSSEGVMVKALYQGMLQKGEYEQSFELGDLPNGIYFIRLQAGENVETAKVILFK